jgi:hypothetical protein
MLNKDGVRELAYIVTVDDIQPIPNYDRVEAAMVGGWRIIVRKDQFKIGDKAVYFEIDSKVPEREPFLFLEKRHFKVKTLKMCKTISQGLLMSFEDFGWAEDAHEVGDFVTSELGVTYADPDDNSRKAASADKYKKMAQRRPKLFKNPLVQWFMRRGWGKKLMFFLFGKKKDKKGGWPAWVKKTDEERCQNLPHYFTTEGFKNCTWYVTEKIDGTSTTFTMKRKKFGKYDFYICSRNVVFDKPNKKCFYDNNVYVEMAEKYDIERFLKILMDHHKDYDFVTIQGETYGEGIQKRTYGIDGHDFMAFNLILGYKDGTTVRLNPKYMTNVLCMWKIPCVPIVDILEELPDSVDEMLKYAAAAPSKLDGGMREGVVLRTENGVGSFKAVSNEFLLKYHN